MMNIAYLRGIHMHFFNLELYKPTDMEDRINKVYKENGVYTASDLNIDKMATIFNTFIAYTEGETKIIFSF